MQVGAATAVSGQPVWIKNLDSKCSHCEGKFDPYSAEFIEALDDSGKAAPFLLKFQCPVCGQAEYPVHVGSIPKSGFDVLNGQVQDFIIEGVDLQGRSQEKGFISV